MHFIRNIYSTWLINLFLRLSKCSFRTEYFFVLFTDSRERMSILSHVTFYLTLLCFYESPRISGYAANVGFVISSKWFFFFPGWEFTSLSKSLHPSLFRSYGGWTECHYDIAVLDIMTYRLKRTGGPFSEKCLLEIYRVRSAVHKNLVWMFTEHNLQPILGFGLWNFVYTGKVSVWLWIQI